MFKERELRKGLKTKTFGHKIYTFDTIDSTNNCARTVANVGATEGIVVIAEEQTAARGRLGRSWQANPGENLTFSVLLRPKANPEVLNLLPLFVGVVIAQAIENVTSLKVECKWPNDLLVNRKKVAGILIEGAIQQESLEYAVVGVGINVNQVQFTGDLLTKATSLKLESGKEIDRAQLLREILRLFETKYTPSFSTAAPSVIPSWLQRSSMINKAIVVSQQGNIMSGIVTGLSKEGALILKTNGTEKTLFSGDVTILGDAPEQLFPLAPETSPVASVPNH